MNVITRLEFCLVTSVCRGDFGVSHITSGPSRVHPLGLPGPTDNTAASSATPERAQQTTPPGFAQEQSRAVSVKWRSADLGDQLADDVTQFGHHLGALPRVLAVE